ncbi:glycoside hydrolase family 88 protein [Ructibacterium gallinarum]|uniref:Glycoside hydrolase family 88 protein n=1 Tax=Ructibacterium gallinarum TaxID=2779355 RepID=A0A9D5R9C8_9FIRM|nr:glycoside hydrolase family 88 protein [Ructibacterium gallinarum]MBE5040945.1 glycoside hydrolase family 88 protein [Ructibacterium gallinarum]
MSEILEQNKDWIAAVWNKVDQKMKKIAVKDYDKIPYTSINGIHDDQKDNLYGWTNGFWGGLMWLLYVGTKDENYKKTALHSGTYVDKGLDHYEPLYHDVGFISHILHGANYRLTGDMEAKNKNLFMAAALASRFNIDGKFIRAWNMDFAEGWSIIDCMMNLPLLYWASEEIGDPRFKRIAMAHADMTLRDHIREDGAINHIVVHDTETGEPVKFYTDMGYDQGYNAEGCWSRGLSWAIYGMAISYVHTGKKEYLNAAKKTANYFLSHAAATGYKTLCDFCQPAEPVYYDSTAGVCAACGMIEISRHVSKAEAEVYLSGALNLLKATDENFCDYSDQQDALVLMGTEAYPNDEKRLKGVHIPIIYGDFFFVEALLKLQNIDFLIW